MHSIKINSRKIKFGDKEINKKEFYSSKQAIPLDSVDLDQIIVSSKWKISDTTYKYLCGYYLEQCKYKLRKRKIVNFIDDEIIDEDSENDSYDSDNKNENDFITSQ